MSHIWLNGIAVKNYRSFGERQYFQFPAREYGKPVAIIGYNNVGKSNLLKAILYGIGESYINSNTFTDLDHHNIDSNNSIEIISSIDGSDYQNQYGPQTIAGRYVITTSVIDNEIKSNCSPTFFGKNKHYNIFYVNFHNIKDEISTQKTGWGNLKSFLGRHIQKLVDFDEVMREKKAGFQEEVKASTFDVLQGSQLQSFIHAIEKNYQQNLRNTGCVVDFGLPHYEDIFLKMLFKIGLNGDGENLMPIEHFGDGFISMFVMAVIQSIAESETEDRCLFLFEEPESFLHENHQEYFYKAVLCRLAEKGHQLIYTTHSDRMIDAFDTQGVIRLELDDQHRTVKKYNNINSEVYPLDVLANSPEPINIQRYNEYVKTVEPNLNRMLFSKKVLLVEGPNDVMVYTEVIRQKVLSAIQSRVDIINPEKFAETYLNYENISFVCHHGKTTALYIIELCKHFNIDYFVITDWDFRADELGLEVVASISTLIELHTSTVYISSDRRGEITNNWNLINNAGIENIHFNTKRLEEVIGYNHNDKNSFKIWNHITADDFVVRRELFPDSLNSFLEINELEQE